jgi:hypothetical protein
VGQEPHNLVYASTANRHGDIVLTQVAADERAALGISVDRHWLAVWLRIAPLPLVTSRASRYISLPAHACPWPRATRLLGENSASVSIAEGRTSALSPVNSGCVIQVDVCYLYTDVQAVLGRGHITPTRSNRPPLSSDHAPDALQRAIVGDHEVLRP